jgi:hypothetical protein
MQNFLPDDLTVTSLYSEDSMHNTLLKSVCERENFKISTSDSKKSHCRIYVTEKHITIAELNASSLQNFVISHNCGTIVWQHSGFLSFIDNRCVCFLLFTLSLILLAYWTAFRCGFCYSGLTGFYTLFRLLFRFSFPLLLVPLSSIHWSIVESGFLFFELILIHLAK